MYSCAFIRSTNQSFDFDSLDRKHCSHSLQLEAGPLQWRGEVSIGGSPPGDASFWVVRRLQVLVWSHSCPTALISAFSFSLPTQRLYQNDHVWLSVVRTGCPLSETALDGWMDGCVRSRAHWNNTVNWQMISVLLGSFLWSSSFFCHLWNCFI